MKEIVGFIRIYAREVNKPALVISTLFITVLIWFNYAKRLEYRLVHESGLPWPRFTAHCLLFFPALFVPYALLLVKRKRADFLRPGFIICLLAAPLIFSYKISMDTSVQVSADPLWDQYWNDILYWPLRLLMIGVALAFLWRCFNKESPLYGLASKKMNWTPYWLMLLIMIPLIVAASTQPDFLATYPKLKQVLPLPENASRGWLYKLLFELSYGSDFLSIEIFFRGFLVIGLMKWVGKDAILPMACFYCTIHFGKPMGECISSYFGGLLLGVVSYHTRSIYGGLMVHLGIAWLMEAGGSIGHAIF